jgi:hypothetical protein
MDPAMLTPIGNAEPHSLRWVKSEYSGRSTSGLATVGFGSVAACRMPALPALDAEKLKENSLTSIRLGIENFQRSFLLREQNGDPARALSAIRNLFAGVLLLFKYKIATSIDDPEDAATLIFNPPEVLPHKD